MNTLDKQYIALLENILEHGTKKQTRNGEVISVFGRQIRHNMKEGFPLLTTKKMAWKTMVVELLWFLRGDTNIKFLVDNDCHIWDGDAYKAYEKEILRQRELQKKGVERLRNSGKRLKVSIIELLSKEEFINKIKTDDEFAKKWGELGPVYGKQWRGWGKLTEPTITYNLNNFEKLTNGIDQIANLINDLKTNPDSRRLMVSSWNVSDLDSMVLPPCHYGFQVYTRELSFDERYDLMPEITGHSQENINMRKKINNFEGNIPGVSYHKEWLDSFKIPTRAISLMFNMRSNDVPLGLPFNLASYGLLLELLAKITNMVPDELIGNLGDCHIYTNQIEGVKEQIGRDYTLEERLNMVSEEIQKEFSSGIVNLPNFPNTPVWSDGGKMSCLDDFGAPRRTREPFPLPKLNINTEWWPTESSECGVGPIDAQAVLRSLSDDNFCRCLLEEDIQLYNYQCHPKITMPLSN